MVGDQKIRYSRLKQVFDKALTQSISKLESWDKVSSCFPRYAETRDGATNLVTCQRQVIEFWTELCRREFDEILVERNVKEKLDELDELVSEAKKRLPASSQRGEQAQHSVAIDKLSSAKLMECNLYKERVKATGQLDERLASIKQINGNLQQELNEIVKDLDNEQIELTKLYDRYLGTAVEQPLDETLVQGLNDMLLELRNI